MTGDTASFRELKGVGPVTEARLHEAGVSSWEALAKVVDALASIRAASGDTLKDLAGAIAERVEVGGGDAPHPGPDPVPGRARREFAVALDAGRVLGGGRRDLALVVDAGAPAGAREAGFDYTATLAARAYGGAAAPAWTALAERRGHGRRPGRLPLTFAAVQLPPGLLRLRLELTLRLAEPTREPPVLALA